MSEEEKRKRDRYRIKRKKLIDMQILVLLCVTLLFAVFGSMFLKFNKTLEIGYTQTSDVGYKVYLKPNDFYEEEYLGKGEAYVASIIKNVEATFIYKLVTESSDVDFEYSYYTETVLEVIDKNSKKKFADIMREENSAVTKEVKDTDSVKIIEQVTVDYAKYNNRATLFLEEYGLSRNDVECNAVTNFTLTLSARVTTLQRISATAIPCCSPYLLPLKRLT